MAKLKLSLADAVFASNREAVEKILAKSTSEVGLQDGMGFTPLHWAADRGDEAITRLLIDAGASPDVPDMEGLTPLHYACIKGNLDAAKIMIPIADIDCVDYKWEHNAQAHAASSARMAAAGFDVERGVPAQKIVDLLAQEPARRAALEQARILAASTGMGNMSKPAKGL